ncbi:MAG: AzlD domain-containing protein [Actinomycetes bacterium]
MTGWGAVLAACAVCALLKLAGYVVPEKVLEGERPSRLAGLVTVSLLAALVAVQTFASGTSLVLDARVAALAVASVALWLRVPFVVVVVLAALVAAALRAFA